MGMNFLKGACFCIPWRGPKMAGVPCQEGVVRGFPSLLLQSPVYDAGGGP